MKKLETSVSLQEMNLQDLQEINGGFVITAVGICVTAIIAGVGIKNAVDNMFK